MFHHNRILESKMYDIVLKIINTETNIVITFSREATKETKYFLSFTLVLNLKKM